VKICGITSLQDAQAAIAAGAECFGLHVLRKSSRFLTAEAVAEITDICLPSCQDGVSFVDAGREFVERTVTGMRVGLSAVSTAGELPAECGASVDRLD